MPDLDREKTPLAPILRIVPCAWLIDERNISAAGLTAIWYWELFPKASFGATSLRVSVHLLPGLQRRREKSIKRRMDTDSSAAAGAALSQRALIRRLLALSWRYRGGCLRALGLQTLVLALGLATLAFSGLGIDYLRFLIQPAAPAPRWPFGVAPPPEWTPMTVLVWISLLILAMALLRAMVSYSYTVYLSRLVQQTIVVELRSQVYDKLQRLGFRFFDARSSGTLINRVTGDVQAVRSFVDSVLVQLVLLVISIVVFLTYMLRVHAGLTLACLAPVPLLWWLTVRFSQAVKTGYTHSSEWLDRLVLRVSECSKGIHVVKGFAREPEQQAEFEKTNAEYRDQKREIFRLLGAYRPFMDVLSQAGLVILLAYGGLLVAHDRLPLGTGLIVMVGLLQRFSGQVNQLADITNSIQVSLAGARRVFEILDAPIEIRSPARPIPWRAPQGHVRFEQVEFAYNAGTPVLHDITFEAHPGECVALVGPTGSGKSTLLSLIPRFYDVTAGRLLIDGIPIAEMDVDELRRRIGLVFQESFLFSNTVAANIAFAHPEADATQIERAARIAAAHEFIRELPQGYDTVLHEGGADLSGGQRQRLAIARAILTDPVILLLDDPTAAVDTHTEHEILSALAEAMRGRTTFLATHRISALRLAHRIVVLDEGRIVTQGPREELMSRGDLAKLLAGADAIEDASPGATLASEAHRP